MIADDDLQHGVTYFKRFRMEADLLMAFPSVPDLSPAYTWLPWHEELLEQHARAKQQSFDKEIDGVIFPNLGSYEGCLRLMRDIQRRPGFCAGATWLIVRDGVPCGTVQGISDRLGAGVIQNLGVIPSERGRGLGAALMHKAMIGFRQAGLGRAALEVTAQNDAAIRLYRRLGFRRRRTLYKAVDALVVLAATEIDWWL